MLTVPAVNDSVTEEVLAQMYQGLGNIWLIALSACDICFDDLWDTVT